MRDGGQVGDALGLDGEPGSWAEVYLCSLFGTKSESIWDFCVYPPIPRCFMFEWRGNETKDNQNSGNLSVTPTHKAPRFVRENNPYKYNI